MIIGQDFLHKLGIDLHFSTKTMTWQGVEVNMKEPTCTKEILFHAEEELSVSEEIDCISKILDKKMQQADLNAITRKLELFSSKNWGSGEYKMRPDATLHIPDTLSA